MPNFSTLHWVLYKVQPIKCEIQVSNKGVGIVTNLINFISQFTPYSSNNLLQLHCGHIH